MHDKSNVDILDALTQLRGLNLYKTKQFTHFKQTENTYTMIVHDTADYKVSVTLDETKNISRQACDCISFQGSQCQHVVTLLHVINEKEPSAHLVKLNQINKTSIREHVKEIVTKLDRQTLDTLFIEQVFKDVTLLRRLTYEYAHDGEKIQLAYQTAYSALESVELSFDAIGYDEEAMEAMFNYASYEIDGIYKEALHTPHPETAVKLLLAVLEAVMDIDRSETDFVSEIYEDAFHQFNKLIMVYEKNAFMRCRIFETLLDYYQRHKTRVFAALSPDYFHVMVATQCARHKHVLYDLLSTLEADDELASYEHVQIQVALYKHLTECYEADKAKTYLMHRLDNDILLKLAYERAMTEEDYAIAVDCADQMLERLAELYNRDRYETYLVEALIKQGNHARAKPILKIHALRGHHNAFTLYEQCFTGEALTQAIAELLEVISKQENTSGLLIHITVKYKRFENLMAYLDKFPQVVTEAYSYLPKQFETRIMKVFEQQMLKMATQASDREAYQSIAWVFHHAQKAVGAKAHHIEKKLLMKYPRKHALRDELQKARITSL